MIKRDGIAALQHFVHRVQRAKKRNAPTAPPITGLFAIRKRRVLSRRASGVWLYIYYSTDGDGGQGGRFALCRKNEVWGEAPRRAERANVGRACAVGGRQRSCRRGFAARGLQGAMVGEARVRLLCRRTALRACSEGLAAAELPPRGFTRADSYFAAVRQRVGAGKAHAGHGVAGVPGGGASRPRGAKLRAWGFARAYEHPSHREGAAN